MSEPALSDKISEIERLLSKPSATPNEFSSWIVKWLTANIDISTYQLRGLADTFFKAAPVIAADEATASTGAWANLATVGPTLSGLSNGRYLAFWGANMGTISSDAVGLMGMSPNGAGPSEDESAKARVTTPAEIVPVIHSREFTLTNVDNNYLQAKYRMVAGYAPRWHNRWLVALKVGYV